MKKVYYTLLLLVLVFLNTSCLKAGLDELETYDLNDITNVRFEYRWWDETDKRMRVQEMEVEKTFDNDKKIIQCSIVVPDASNTFSTEIRNNVSLRTLAINVDASTASRITPLNGAPTMGVFPSDFSSGEFQYAVMAGNGDIANWTIKIVDFQK